VLFTEASSTSARQALYALGRRGYIIDVCDPNPFCLGRFSRYIRSWLRCPPFGREPEKYLQFLRDRLSEGRYDVLFPVHDQVFLLAQFADLFERQIAVALSPMAALQQVQCKAAFVRLLDELALPHPTTKIVRGVKALQQHWQFPCYIKLAFGTAGTGVWFVQNQQELDRVAGELQTGAPEEEILVQEPAQGTFTVTQAVFQKGLVVAAHSYRARAMGVGGSACCRESVLRPVVERDLALLGAHLGWHGALHVEYFYDEIANRPSYIDSNPRIGETLNATLSGTNLCDILIQVSLGHLPSTPMSSTSRAGVRTHSLITSVLAAAERGAGRRQLLAELYQACTKRGLYDESSEETNRVADDWLSGIPLAAVLARLLLIPRSARRIIRSTVANYALDAPAVQRIQDLARTRSERS
jgi:predicted ATP-grasp superfamily ATP-dependent carboligase